CRPWWIACVSRARKQAGAALWWARVPGRTAFGTSDAPDARGVSSDNLLRRLIPELLEEVLDEALLVTDDALRVRIVDRPDDVVVANLVGEPDRRGVIHEGRVALAVPVVAGEMRQLRPHVGLVDLVDTVGVVDGRGGPTRPAFREDDLHLR